MKTRFSHIRVESIEFSEEPCIAIHFDDVTRHFEQLQVHNETIAQKSKKSELSSFQAGISQELKTPLSTCLMFIENLSIENLTEQGARIIKVITCQLNTLLCVISDNLDFQLIKEDKFVTKEQIFSPKKSIEAISGLFRTQSEMQNTKLEYAVHESPFSRENSLLGQNEPVRLTREFPEFLKGDQLRFKQVLINLTYYTLKSTINGFLQIDAAYDYASKQLKVSIINQKSR